MAFNVNDRVRVTAQDSEHRGHFGTVLSVGGVDSRAGQMYGVRLDGHGVAVETDIPENKLQGSTQPDPIDYSQA